MCSVNDSSDNWIFYRDREEWKDVEPLPQNDGPFPVVQIAYTEKFEDVYDYFRAILASGEKSERALKLTRDAAELNPANYTVWQYRRQILKHLNKELQDELNFVREMIEESPKNYQVWHHRRVLVEWLQDPDKELRLTEIMLAQDSKNYHAWQHRQWIVRTFNLYEGEVGFCDKLLEADVRNNSAWNHKFFVVYHGEGFSKPIVRREVEFAKAAINKAFNNDSPWNYLRGVLEHSDEGMLGYEGLEQWLESCYCTQAGCSCAHLLGFMIDLWVETMEKDSSSIPTLLPKVIDFCSVLSNQHDKIRKEYWQYLSRRTQKKFGEVSNGS